MAEKGTVHPISKESLEKHLKKVDEHMESINRGGTERPNLFDLLGDIGEDKHVQAKEVGDTISALRDGFSLYYEMHATLEDRVKEVNSDVKEDEKRLFLNSYSMFATASFIEHKLDLIISEKEPFSIPRKKDYFNFEITKDDVLNGVLARYYGVVSINKRNNTLKTGSDLPAGSIDFFKFLKEEALARKSSFDSKLVELVQNAQFRIGEEFTITGFEAKHEDKVRAKIDFIEVMPYQVAGNVLAKKEMIRDMDRIPLFDLTAQRNPILEVGGLSWSVLYDGLPGTGKSTLFRMGLTRLKQRCEQAGQFWKSKNIGDLKWRQIIIDQSIKDEYYGKTGKNLLEKIEQTKKADGIYIMTIDDIDLLVNDRDTKSGGADKDILNILMQYVDGINTVIRGNVQMWAATNDATSMDPALRQRFLARYPVDGPQQWYDFADIFSDKLGNWIKLGIVKVPNGKEYLPFEMRKGQTGYEKSSQKNPLIEKIKEKFRGGVTLRDIGELCDEMRKKNPRFTGRAVHAVSEAIKKRINDYDIPGEWYEKPEIFFSQPYETRVEMLKELCGKITGDVIVHELENYFDSEERYASDKFESDVGKTIHNLKVNQEAVIRYGKEAKK